MPSPFGRKLPAAAVNTFPSLNPLITGQLDDIISRRLKLGQPRRCLALLSEVISRVIRRRPLFAPRKDIRDFHILALRRCVRILPISDPHRATPLMIRRQPIPLAFLPAQPFAKCFRILPTHIYRRMVGSLLKPRLLPRSPRRIAKGLVVFHPRLPDAEEHIRSRHRNEFSCQDCSRKDAPSSAAPTPPGSEGGVVTGTICARLEMFGVDSGAFFGSRAISSATLGPPRHPLEDICGPNRRGGFLWRCSDLLGLLDEICGPNRRAGCPWSGRGRRVRVLLLCLRLTQYENERHGGDGQPSTGCKNPTAFGRFRRNGGCSFRGGTGIAFSPGDSLWDPSSAGGSILASSTAGASDCTGADGGAKRDAAS